EGDGDDSQHGRGREPISKRPEHGRDEMAVAVHVGIGIGGARPKQIQRVLPAERRKDLKQNEEADHNAVAYKLVRDYGLDEESEKNKDQDLREGHHVEFLEILEQLVVVIAGDGLHKNAHEHREREEYEIDDDDSGQTREPVGGLAHGKSIVNA